MSILKDARIIKLDLTACPGGGRSNSAKIWI